MRFLNEIVWCLSDILVTAFPSICPLKLTKADQSQLPSFPYFDPSPFIAYERESSAGDITIDVHQGFFVIFKDVKKYNAKNWIYLTDSEGSTG